VVRATPLIGRPSEDIVTDTAWTARIACRTIGSEVRAGIFAMTDIKSGTEVTFNYNFIPCSLEGAKACKCGSYNCSGFLGVKPDAKRGSKRARMKSPAAESHRTETFSK